MDQRQRFALATRNISPHPHPKPDGKEQDGLMEVYT